MRNTPRLPSHYYCLTSEDGSLRSSRFGAANDSFALQKARQYLGVSVLPPEVSLWRIVDGARTHYVRVPTV
jgi:hypothetical protein